MFLVYLIVEKPIVGNLKSFMEVLENEMNASKNSVFILPYQNLRRQDKTGWDMFLRKYFLEREM